MKQKVVAVIPAHNEASHVAQVVTATKKYVDEVIVVDDGSKDNTLTKAETAGANTLRHIVNLGKGAALKTGCDYAVEHKASIIIMMDADAQHEPADIPAFLEQMKSHEVVLAYRKISKSMPLVFKVGNGLINKTIKYLYGISVKDTQCGFRAFSSEAYKKIRWKSVDYSLESEMIVRIGKAKLSFAEIPIKTIYADRYKGTTVIDGVKIVLSLVLWKLRNNW